MTPQFDRYAKNYGDVLDQVLEIAGETRDYFARARIEILGRILKHRGLSVASVLDYGCGDGSAAPHFREQLGADRVLGIDSSGAMIDAARRNYGSAGAKFLSLEEFEPQENFDLVFCNGVFHHIKSAGRPATLDLIRRSLRPDGLFAFWENNPWNPGTQYVMSKIPFDKDAEKISSSSAKRMLGQNGFQVLEVGHYFVFPKMLRGLRFLEPLVASLPVGALYQILTRKISLSSQC